MPSGKCHLEGAFDCQFVAPNHNFLMAAILHDSDENSFDVKPGYFYKLLGHNKNRELSLLEKGM